LELSYIFLHYILAIFNPTLYSCAIDFLLAHEFANRLFGLRVFYMAFSIINLNWFDWMLLNTFRHNKKTGK